MKKFLISILALSGAVAASTTLSTVSAQVNPIANLPNEKGQTIVNKCYDGEGNLRATMRYEIAEYTPTEYTDDLKVIFTMTDAQGNVIDEGTIDAYYDGEELQLNMSNRSETSDIGDYLSMNTKLTDDFLNYPDNSNNDFTFLDDTDPFRFDAADYTIQIGERPRDFMHIKISNRSYVGDEKITTPAGDFSAKKSTFTLEVYNHDTRARDTYHGTEWYADGEGIVRTEITDGNGHLVDYSEIVETYTRE